MCSLSMSVKPASPISRRAVRALSSTASSSNGQRNTASRVSGLSGLCSIRQATPPGRTTRRISARKPAQASGGTWCSTQLAKARSKAPLA